jgi:CRISPR-associated protein Cmr1
LPIIGRFQRTPRGGGASYHEPPDFTLKWRERGPRERDEDVSERRPRERLASPLILKALPLANGRFVAIALWLHRAWPEGDVVLVIGSGAIRNSAARFDTLEANGEESWFTPLAGKTTLRSAFFDWLEEEDGVKAVFRHRDGAGGCR